LEELEMMNNHRIRANIKNLQMAEDLIVTAFEDLKNIQAFRLDPRSDQRRIGDILSAISEVIASARDCDSEKKD
jgi:hypothetical protein